MPVIASLAVLSRGELEMPALEELSLSLFVDSLPPSVSMSILPLPLM